MKYFYHKNKYLILFGGNVIVKDCTTCRWAGCRSYGKENGLGCEKYIMSLEEKRKIMIMKRASNNL